MKNTKKQLTDLPEFLTNPNPEVYLNDLYVVIDFETTTIGKGLAVYSENRIVGCSWRIGEGLRELAAQFGWVPGETYYRRAGEYNLADVVSLCGKATFLVAHNAKFDLQWLERCGIALESVLCFDTLLAEYVIGGNRWMYDKLSLEKIARRRWGEGKIDLIKKMWDVGTPTEDIPEEWLSRYCVRDVELTERLFRDQRVELQDLNLLPVLYNRCLLTPVLADIEKNGLQLDADLVRTRSEELELEFVRLEQQLNKITGGINFNSRIQLADYLYNKLGFMEKSKKSRGKWVPIRTETGRPLTDAETISTLKARTGPQREFQETWKEYQRVWSELTKYLRKLSDCCDQAAGLMLATFNQSSTQTHRLSSTGLNFSCQFQNFPRAYKPLFRARNNGWLIGECDGAQLEFRDAVHLGRDAVGLFDIISGTDIHSVTAGVIWPDLTPSDGSKHPKRQDAKPHTFKPLYGGKSGTPEEVRYYTFFREKYKGIAEWQQSNIDYVLANGYLTTEWGLRYYWPNTKAEISYDGSIYVTNTTAICNYPVQAQATAEIIPMAVVWFWHRLKRSGLKMFMVNTVHDSIIVELPPDEVEEFHELSRQCLIDDVYGTLRDLYGIAFTVPLGAGVKVARHWSGKDAAEFVPAGMDHDKGEVVYVANDDLWKDAAIAAGMLEAA